MSGFSIDELDAIARGVGGASAPASGKTKAPSAEPTQEDLNKARRTKVLNPQLQPDTEPTVTASQSDFSFDMKNLDKQAFQIASGKIETPKTEPSSITKFGQGLAALGDVTVGSVLPAIAGTVTYPVARAVGGLYMQPKEASEFAKREQERLVSAIDKPFGKFAGVTETAGYKGEAVNQLVNFIGENVSKGADWIAQKTGIPKGDVESYMNTIGLGLAPTAGKAVSTTGKGALKVAEAVVKPVVEEGKMIAGAIKEKLPTVRLEMQKQLEAKQVPELTKNIDQLQQQFEQQKAAGQAKPATETITSPTGEPVSQINLGTSKPTTPDAPYTELSYSEKGLPLDEQYARARVLQKVLGDDHAVDLAAIEGKGKERATNFDVSRTDTPQGNLLAERIADEQRRLAKYGEGLVKKTGGTLGLDEATLYKRGNTQLAPFEEYGNLLDKEIGKLYKERDKTAKEVPIQTNFTKDLLNDDSIIQLADNEKLAKATTAKMKQLGIMDKDGNLLNTDAFKAEQLRKWLNEPNVWSPQNAGLHRALKDSIDNDVFAHADKAIYDDARKLFGLKKDTLDNPKGIATILDESGPNGINRKVDVEKVANKIAGMGVDQFTHIIDTLDKMPAELQPKAQKAKAEIKSQFLNQALAQKSPNKLTTYMNDNREVMNRLFTPEEMADIRDYHNASQILKTDVGYKGAAVQKINVEQKLAGKIGQQLLQKGGAAGAEVLTGGAGMGVPAVVAHEYIGSKFEKGQAKKVAKAEEEAFKKTQERFVPIKDLLKLKNQPLETTNRIELRNMAPGQPD
jgi:hypothetical protein